MKPDILRPFLLGCALTIMASAHAAEESNPQYYSEIVRLDASDPDGHLNDMLAEGAIMLNRREDIALMLLPSDVGTSRSRSSLYSLPRHVPQRPRFHPEPTMDKALMVSGVDRIVTGAGLSQPYDGSGVVVGFCDIGFDSRHLNFTDSDGNCRIARVVQYAESEGGRHVYSTPEEIYAFRTDSRDQFHGTHVAGIMAGSYRTPEGIVGVASGAEIVATVSELTDVGLLAGVEDIIAYAKEVGKPAVINLSMGSYTGPHDGTSLFCQYLDLCAEDAIICLSSGNEGAHTNHQYLPKASTGNALRLRIASNDWVNLRLYGQTDIYAADDTPFTLALRITDGTQSGASGFVYETSPIHLDETPFTVVSSTQRYDTEVWQYDKEFARHFAGEVYIEGGIDPENGRYFASVIYNCSTEEMVSSEKPWARYRLELIARPEAPTRLDGYADGSRSWFSNWSGNPIPPGSEMSVSDLATGHKTISVGMYCTGNNVQLVTGAPFEVEFDTPLQVTTHSSYGELLDGRKLPLTVGPGMPVVSSINAPYVSDHGDGMTSLVQFDSNGTRHYWGPMSGTSMSCPFVAGTIATWLQADPSLTWREVQQLIADTNFYPYFVSSDTQPRYGMGLFDGYGALLKILGQSSVSTPGIYADKLAATLRHGALEILNPGGSDITVDVVSLTGTLLRTLTFPASSHLSIPMEDLSPEAAPLIFRISTPTCAPVTIKHL